MLPSPAIAPSPQPAPPIIEVRGVSHSYDSLRQAVSDLHFSIGKGEILALVGPNGAGKSTTLRMLATLLLPGSGTITLCGHDAVSERDQVRRQVGYLPDHFSLYDDLTPVQLLDFFGRCHGLSRARVRSRTDELLGQLDLLGKRESKVAGLSRGMKQRLGIAKTLLHEPAVVILDEPASGLDPLARSQVRELLLSLNRAGTTLVISSHILAELSGIATSVCILERGRLAKSGPLQSFVEESYQATQTFRLRVLGGVDKIDAAMKKAGISRYSRHGTRDLLCEAEGEERLAEIIQELVLRGVRVSGAAPVESQLEAIYRASARGEVA